MSPSTLLLFAGLLLLGSASPGPAVVALVARTLGHGRRGLPGFIAGLIVGDVFWLTVAVLGLAVVAKLFAPLFLAVRILGALYLAWLGIRLWRARGDHLPVPPREAKTGGSFLAALFLTFGNPKVMAFYLALLPSLIDLRALDLAGYVALVAVMVPILVVVLGGYVVLALRARRYVTSPRAVRLVNRAAGTAMLGAALAVAAR
ncbi:MAG TPA: LysE family translocator [Hyphomicrobiales bacterium]|nr:LysE family translocator [Hyphomicrobiales bacterium]